MVKKMDIVDYKSLGDTTIYINCDLLTDYNRDEFIKKLIDLCSEYKEGRKE